MNLDVVTTSSPTLNMPRDPSLMDYDKGFRQKIELTLRENRALNFIKRQLWKADLPDSKRRFADFSATVLDALKNPPDVI